MTFVKHLENMFDYYAFYSNLIRLYCVENIVAFVVWPYFPATFHIFPWICAFVPLILDVFAQLLLCDGQLLQKGVF